MLTSKISTRGAGGGVGSAILLVAGLVNGAFVDDLGLLVHFDDFVVFGLGFVGAVGAFVDLAVLFLRHSKR